MTTNELNKLCESLEEELKLIEGQLNNVSTTGPDGTAQPKRVDYGDSDDEDSYAHEVTDLDLNLAQEHRLKERLEEIKTTLEKIKAGKYGQCEACSQDIHPERLKVMPIAALCISCARKIK